MLAKINRLKKKKDFERVFKEGRGYQEDFLFLKVAKNELKNSRFGFAVSKKFLKKVHTRNKVKRRLREIVRKNLEKIKKGVDIILIVRSGLEEKSFSEVAEIVEKLFRKAKLF